MSPIVSARVLGGGREGGVISATRSRISLSVWFDAGFFLMFTLVHATFARSVRLSMDGARIATPWRILPITSLVE